MAEYAIYEHPKRPRRFVKRGWRWPAFFLFGFWLIYKGLWLHTLGLVLLSGLLGALPVIGVLAQIALFIVVGKYGGTWEERRLLRLGYLAVGTVEAGSKTGAEAHFLRGPVKPMPTGEAPGPPPPPPPESTHPNPAA